MDNFPWVTDNALQRKKRPAIACGTVLLLFILSVITNKNVAFYREALHVFQKRYDL
jgi:hypothetical protein